MIVGVCRLIANHLHLAFFESIPEVRVLPSTGITRLQRSYYPVRLPPMPPPEATLRPLPSHQRVSPDYPNHLSNVPCPLPRRIERVRMSIASPHHALRHSTGYKLANQGEDTRSLAHYLGHRNLQSTARYTALAPDRFKGFWKD